MASELIVQTLKGPTSGANANKVIVPAGQTLDASAGVLVKTPETGEVVQVVTQEMTQNGSTASNGVVFEVSGTGERPTITQKLAGSSLIMDAAINVWGDTDNDSHGYVQVNIKVERWVNGSYQSDVFNRGSLVDRGGGQNRMRGIPVRFKDAANQANDEVMYIFYVTLVTTTNSRSMNVNAGNISYATIMEIAG